jgi:hypothetical protein
LQPAKTFIAGSLGSVTELGQDEAAGTCSLLTFIIPQRLSSVWLMWAETVFATRYGKLLTHKPFSFFSHYVSFLRLSKK